MIMTEHKYFEELQVFNSVRIIMWINMVVVVKNKNFKFILKTTTFVILVACFAYFYLIEIANLYFAESTTFSTKRLHAKNSVLPSV